jgi:hypothetical protein
MNNRIPEPIRPMLQAYLDQLEQQLPGFAEGVYIHGSIALDAFDEQHSDIDMLVVITRHASEDDIQKLKAIHESIASQYPRWLLEANYIQVADLGQPDSATPPHPTYHDNVFEVAGIFDTSPVTWWVLKHKGITLKGVEAQQLPFTADWETVLNYMRENINTYWASFTTYPPRMGYLLFDDGIAWVVTGVLRQYYSLRENDITSKVGAGEYALKVLPSEWHGLIQDALDIRQGKKPTHYESNEARASATTAFLHYIIAESNAIK